MTWLSLTAVEPALYVIGLVVVLLAGLAGLYTALEFARLGAYTIRRSLRP